jgi:hypothetical protein
MTEQQNAPQQEDPIMDVVVTLEYRLREINEIIHMINAPNDVPAIPRVNLINNIQVQCQPFIEAYNKERQNESKATT